MGDYVSLAVGAAEVIGGALTALAGGATEVGSLGTTSAVSLPAIAAGVAVTAEGATVISNAQNSLSVTDENGRVNADGSRKGSETNPHSTSRQARRDVMREEGIPTSQQPNSQSRNQAGKSYEYEVPKPGGGTQKKSVQQQTMDRSHEGSPHFEAGKVKTDPRTGETRYNDYGRPKLQNDKSKSYYKDN